MAKEIDPIRFTTAQALGSYRRELQEEGLPGDLVESLVRDAASHLHMDGLCLATPVSAVSA